nr:MULTISPECIES: metal-dependent hydrolase [unclassified Actinoplanes]
MGKSHALSGAVGWLAGCAVLAAAGSEPSPLTVAIGAAVATGMALAPDVDHPQSTIAHSLGWLTCLIAGGVERAAAVLRTSSCRHCSTGPDRGGHRGITHTALCAVLAGAITTTACLAAGRVAALIVVGVAVWLPRTPPCRRG